MTLLSTSLATADDKSKALREMRKFKGTVVDASAADPMLAAARPAVVAVEALDDNGRMVQTGTGFYIQTDQVVTSLHVVEPGSTLQLVLSDGKKRDVAGVFGVDPFMDLAVLWVTNPPPADKVLPLRQHPAEKGESVYLLAAPKQLPIKETKGEVLGEFDLGSDLVNEGLILSVPAAPGFSGSPTLDASGNVIGVTTAIFKHSKERTSMAVPITEISGLITAQPVPWAGWRREHPVLDLRAAAFLHAAEEVGFDQPALALAHYNEAVKLSPECTSVWMKRGFCLYRLQRYPDAAMSFHKALGREPGLMTARLFLSMSLGKNDQLEEALIDAQTVVTGRPRSAFAWRWMAALQKILNNHPECVAAMRKTLDLGGGFAANRAGCGRLWDSMGCLAAAEKQFREAVQIQPKDGGSWLLLAAVLLETGRTAEANEALNRALKENPDSGLSRYLAFLIAAREGNEKQARRKFEDFVEAAESWRLRPGDAARAAQYLAAMKTKKWDDPLVLFGTTQLLEFVGATRFTLFNMQLHLEKDPSLKNGWGYLSGLYSRLGRFERAIEAAEKAIAQAPEDGRGYQMLGFAQGALGNLEGARSSFVKAHSLSPRDSGPLIGLACIETRNGNAEAARARLAEARECEPKRAAEFENRLQTFFPDATATRAAASTF